MVESSKFITVMVCFDFISSSYLIGRDKTFLAGRGVAMVKSEASEMSVRKTY